MSVCKKVDQSSPSLSVHSLVHSFIGSFLGSLIQSFVHPTRITGPLPYAGTVGGPAAKETGEIGACSNEGWESEGLHLFQAAAEGLGLFCFVFETEVG